MNDNGLRLIVENLGPIGSADVEVRPLTVLIGKNNTGKTYLAQALYAALRTPENLRPRFTKTLTTDELNQLVKTLRKSPSDEYHRVLLRVCDLPAGIQGKMTEWVGQAFRDASTILEKRLLAYFSEPKLGNITRWNHPGTVSVELRNASGKFCYFSTNHTTEPGLPNIANIKANWPLPVLDHYFARFPLRDKQVENSTVPTEYAISLFGDNVDNERIADELSWMVVSMIWSSYLREVQLDSSAHYLPAGRSGLLQAWTDVVKLRLELERERYGLLNIPETSLDGIALDFIGSLAEILGRRHSHRRYQRHNHQLWGQPELDFTDTEDEPRMSDETNTMQLLRQIMQGEIDTGSGEDAVPILEYRQGEKRIPVRRASSMVADLAPLAMWIDRIVERGDLLIIDEPESHLHPEAISSVARVLVRLVNEGVRVVCATHSSVLLHALSNCILRGELSQSARDGLGSDYTESDVLPFDKIAVYRFLQDDPSEPVAVAPVEIESDWGIPEEEYVKVASELSDESAHLIDILS